MSTRAITKISCVLFVLTFVVAPGFGATRHKSKTSKTSLRKGRHTPVSHLSRLHRKRYIVNPWTEPTFADSTVGDLVDGEDLVVRQAALQALGTCNATVVVTEPRKGPLLAIVNHHLH